MVYLSAHFRVHRGYVKAAPKDALSNLPKDTKNLRLHLRVHLRLPLNCACISLFDALINAQNCIKEFI